MDEDLANMKLNNIRDLVTNNKSFEIILKTAPKGMKMGLLNMKSEQAQPVHKLLGVTKETYALAQERGLTMGLLELSQFIHDPIFNKTEAEWLEMMEYIKSREEDLDFYEISYSLPYYYRGFTCRVNENILLALLCTYYKVEEIHKFYSFGKFCDYIIDESINQGYTSLSNFFNDLKDYLSMCIERDIKPSLYSSYLKQTHDIAARNYKLYISEEDEKRFMKAYENFNNVYYEKYCIIAPKSSKEVRQEGNALNHCVASYIKSIIDGKTQIVFLRKKDKKEESLVTVEIRDGRIAQAHGASNRRPTADELAILKKYAEARELQISSSVH